MYIFLYIDISPDLTIIKQHQICLYKTRSRKWYSCLPVTCPWSVVLSGYSGFSTTKTDCHDVAEILLKVVLKHNKSINVYTTQVMFIYNV